MASEQKPSEEAMRVWHRIDRDNNRSVMLYTLRQDGWRKGQPVMINDLMITIDSSIESTADVLGTARVIEATLKARDEVGEPVDSGVDLSSFLSEAIGDISILLMKAGRDADIQNWTARYVEALNRHDEQLTETPLYKGAVPDERAQEWQPIETAPYNEIVEVKAGHMKFEAILRPGISMSSDGEPCDQWEATHEGEHPPCWSGGACWEINESECASLQPTAWRPKAPETNHDD